MVNKFELIKRNCAEIINEDKIKKFMKKGVVYCGYECSGEIHLGHLVTILKLLDLQKAGIKVKILLADWHTWLNKKGDWDFVNKQLKQWEKGMKAVGLKAEFVKGTSFQRKTDYIDDVLKLALNVTVNRGVRAMQQINRSMENAKISQIIYPLMQIEDVKKLGVNFVVAGTDQRKIYMLGIDERKEIELQDAVYLYTPLIPGLKGPGSKKESLLELFHGFEEEILGGNKLKLVSLDDPEKRTVLIRGALDYSFLFESWVGTTKEKKAILKFRLENSKGEAFEESFKIGEGKPIGDLFIQIEDLRKDKTILKIFGEDKQKMSSSIKGSFISIRDKKQEIIKKINKAYCKKGDVKNNPVLAICKLIIFPKFEKIKIKRDKKFGGDLVFSEYSDLEKYFESGKLHALDMKNAVADYLEKIIAPIREDWK